MEPALGPDVRGGLSVPGDLAVDNRMLLAALRTAAERTGATFVESAARAVLDDGTRVTGVRTDGADLESDVVIVCAGAHSGALHPALDGLVRPVKGEILRLAHPPGRSRPRAAPCGPSWTGAPSTSCRATGAASSRRHAGRDRLRHQVTVGGVRDLLRDAERVLPGITEYALAESAAGLRPGSPDNLPLVGRARPDGLLVATGHHRNGVLLAPVTADAVLQLLHGRPVPDAMRPADPARVTGAAPSAGRGHRYPEEVARARVDQR